MRSFLLAWIGLGALGLLNSRQSLAQTISWSAPTVVAAENAGTVRLLISIDKAGAAATTVEVALVPGLSTATVGADFAFATQAVTFAAGSTGGQEITVPIIDDQLAEGAEYFTLQLRTPANGTVAAGKAEVLVYLRDNDDAAPVRTGRLGLRHLGSYQNGEAGKNSAEIMAFDPGSKRLFVANSVGGRLDIVDMANPALLEPVVSVDIKTFGNINSVAVRAGVVACAVENAAPQQNGSVVFFDQRGALLKQLTVGAMPDMIAFSPDGQWLLTANEGEPKSDYSLDPEGSVSIIDLTGGVSSLTQASVTTVGFSAYNDQAAQLRQAGIRLYGGTATAPSSVAQDLEPEYIAVSADSRMAYITLQENNAIATLDLTTKQFTALRSVGYQEHSQAGFALDASDKTPEVLLANWPVKGMRQPDALAAFDVNGQRYLLTANEGDARDYSALAEAVRLKDLPLDATAFPYANVLKDEQALGRLNVTNRLGDTDGDGDFDEIYAFGGRSISIYNAGTGALVHDTGSLLERLISTDPTVGSIFNASNTTGAPARKNRSDDKGPEPEGVAVATLRDTVYGFVALERIGGVAVFNLNNPAAPELVQYINNRSLTAGTGDQGPEGIIVVSPENSPSGKPLLLLANEVSSSVAVYELQLSSTVTASRPAVAGPPLHVYPNPALPGRVRLSRPAAGTVYDLLGRPMRSFAQTSYLSTIDLVPGVYILRATDGATTRVVVQ